MLSTKPASRSHYAAPRYGTQVTKHSRGSSGEVHLSDCLSSIGRETVVVVKDINADWTVHLGKSLGVNSAFFEGHARPLRHHIVDLDIWDEIIAKYPSHERRRRLCDDIQSNDTAYYWHVDGVCNVDPSARYDPHIYSLRRAAKSRHGWSVSTRISLWRSDDITLILVDDVPPGELHLPVSKNRSGLVLPMLHNSLHDTICTYLSHPRHLYAIFAQSAPKSISPVLFCYSLMSSTWMTIVQGLEADAKHIGFQEIRTPTVATNNKLHDLRRDIDALRKQVDRGIQYIPEEVRTEEQTLATCTSRPIESSEALLRRLMTLSASLDQFIMNSFTLLLSSISVREAEISRTTAKRAQHLTTLAFVYVPLSFVTGCLG